MYKYDNNLQNLHIETDSSWKVMDIQQKTIEKTIIEYKD